MAQEQFQEVGHRLEAEVKAVKGHCSWGHKVGDKFPISAHNTGGLCGFFYHDVFPYIMMLQFDGGFPAEWGPRDQLTLECMDRANAVKLRIRRVG